MDIPKTNDSQNSTEELSSSPKDNSINSEMGSNNESSLPVTSAKENQGKEQEKDSDGGSSCNVSYQISHDSNVDNSKPLQPIREVDDDGEKKDNKLEEIKPVAAIISKTCGWCKKINVDMFKCSRCRCIYYCEVECQRADWPTHKLICKKYEEPPKEMASYAQATEREGFERFRDIKKVGQGNFSDIFSGIEITTNKIYAIKRISKMRLKQVRKEDDLMMEKHCLRKLSGSQYVIEMYETFQDTLNLYVKMEYVGNGELWNLLKNFGLQSLTLTKYFMSHILLALKYIHSKGIVHRDLKPENIMLTKENRLKLIDFGTARDLLEPSIKGSGNSAKGKKVFDHFVGTPNFMAPECIHNKDSNYKSDVWSFGCLAVQLVTGFPAYMGGSEYLIFEKALNKLPILPDYLFSEVFKDLILTILKKNFEERPTIEEIMKHPFFENWDFEKIPTFSFCAQDMTPIEKHIYDIKEDILNAKNKGVYFTKYHKKELSEKFEEYLKNLDDLHDKFNEKEIEMLKQRINYLERQFRQFYEMESFSWGDD